MIGVGRTESPLQAADAQAALEGLEANPGIWMGCDVVAEKLYTLESISCARAALRLCLDGNRLTVNPLSDAGAALLKALGPFPGQVDSGL